MNRQHGVVRTIAVALVFASASFGAACERSDTTSVPESAVTTTFSIQDIDCQECGHELSVLAGKHAGVYAATYDRKQAELSVQHAPTLSADNLLGILRSGADEGVLVVVGAGQGRYLAEVEFDPALDMRVITRATSVKLRDHLVADKITVFDFYAAWCKPCRQVDHHMKDLLANSDDVALRKLDVVDWDSELARDYLSEIPTLPYAIVYSAAGRKIGSMQGLHLDELDSVIARARAKDGR